MVLIEGGAGGTTAARVGCMPSKLLIAAANAAHGVAHAKAFGIDARVHGIDGHEVMDRVRRERSQIRWLCIEGRGCQFPESGKLTSSLALRRQGFLLDGDVPAREC